MNQPRQSKAPRLIEILRHRIRYRHYSIRTERAYVFWVRRFIRFHNLRHPREMAVKEVEGFLAHLAVEQKVASATHRQALAAILFLYREVLQVNLPWLQEIGRPLASKHIPVVLSREEVARLLSCVDASHATIIKLLYGAGLRLMECLRLRIKDIDFDRKVIVVRSGKGGKDRVVMLPTPLMRALRHQISVAHSIWAGDRAQGVPGVELPERLDGKFPRACETFAWHWVFPASSLSLAPRSNIRRRHHVYEQTVGRAIARAARRADLSRNVTAHTLRHSFATHLLDAGVNIRRVQELLGHSDVRTTMIYTHVLSSSAAGTASPLEGLLQADPPSAAAGPPNNSTA